MLLYFHLMYASYLALGPIVWLYVRSYLKTNPIRQQALFIHFLPALILVGLAFRGEQLEWESLWFYVYWLLLSQPIFYVIASFLLINKTNQNLTQDQARWLYGLQIAVIVIAAMNILYCLIHFHFYLVISSLLIIMVYMIISLAFNNKLNILFGKNDRKYKNLKLSTSEIEKIWIRLNKSLDGNDLYLDNQLNLSKLAKAVDEPAHVISMVINTKSGSSFNDFINCRRIEKAQAKICVEKDAKMIAIALDTGFSSLSAFNNSFKKYTGLNPSEYRLRNS